MKKTTLLILSLILSIVFVKAQDEENEGLQISGSVDTYWKYDFSGYKDESGIGNIPTSFADEQNSISIGMIDVALSQTVGKASFVGEFAFGPRSFKSIPLFQPDDGFDDIYVGIQNLYASYAFTDVFSLTAGYMGTFVGYEVISPAANFNYSTSYLFTNGPFQNSGIKADFAISDRLAFMVGLFNDWNVYQDINGVSDFGAQVYFMPVDGWDVYVNFITGDPSGTVIDLTTGWQITDELYVGLNAADYAAKGDDAGGYTGVALYPQYAFTDGFSLGFRYENFKFKEFTNEDLQKISSQSVNAFTLTANLKAGPLTVIPEFRLDGASDEFFYKNSDGVDMTKSASQFLVAAVYAF
ncbi:MAG: porin [Cytophagales bacterium]|nr:porin [Cytophagales bacterium]